MKPKSILLILCFVVLSGITFGKGKPVPVTAVQITIDANGARKAISPLIYGKNNSLSDNSSSPVSSNQLLLLKDAGIMMFRESGGNNSTKYNWEKKLSSHPDWYNNVYPHDWDYAASTLLTEFPGASGMWTLGLIGKAAGNTSNNFNDWGYNQSKWWSGVTQNLAGGGTVNPAGGSAALKNGDPTMYLENWPADKVVGILDSWFVAKGYDRSRLKYWNMDNEPEIWSGTHDDVMPVQISAEAFMQQYFETAKKARAKFPEIKLVGPVPANEWQWYNWNNDRIQYNNQSYCWLEYFIKRVAEEQARTGIRLLDVLDIHFYPGETSSTDIVQLHRVFFDRNYVYPGSNGVHRLGTGGWDTKINKEYIFGRCMDWLKLYLGTNHGVTLAVTEMGIQTGDPNVRAVWYASTMGEFARFGVEIFTPWTWEAGMYEVVHLFSRYNQPNFLKATSGDSVNVSAYPTVNATGDALTIVLVNRSLTATKDAQVTISNFTPADGPVNYYRLNGLTTTESFKSHTSNALKTGTITPSAGVLKISLPPLSITSLIVKKKTTASTGFSGSFREEMNLTVFPNPVASEFTVSWPLPISGDSHIDLFNSSGQIMMTRGLDREALNNYRIQFKTDNLPSGVYFVRLKTESTVSSAKFFVLH